MLHGYRLSGGYHFGLRIFSGWAIVLVGWDRELCEESIFNIWNSSTVRTRAKCEIVALAIEVASVCGSWIEISSLTANAVSKVRD